MQREKDEPRASAWPARGRTGRAAREVHRDEGPLEPEKGRSSRSVNSGEPGTVRPVRRGGRAPGRPGPGGGDPWDAASIERQLQEATARLAELQKNGKFLGRRWRRRTWPRWWRAGRNSGLAPVGGRGREADPHGGSPQGLRARTRRFAPSPRRGRRGRGLQTPTVPSSSSWADGGGQDRARACPGQFLFDDERYDRPTCRAPGAAHQARMIGAPPGVTSTKGAVDRGGAAAPYSVVLLDEDALDVFNAAAGDG